MPDDATAAVDAAEFWEDHYARREQVWSGRRCGARLRLLENENCRIASTFNNMISAPVSPPAPSTWYRRNSCNRRGSWTAGASATVLMISSTSNSGNPCGYFRRSRRRSPSNPQLTVALAAIVYPHDVWMPQRGRDVGFAIESLVILVIGGERRRQYLERFPAAQPRVLDQINLSHRTVAQQPLDGVPGESVARA